ncbi:MAG: hypothetical protein C0501_04735 [Isosphaera sp.]|nr:hypothetical protein [Isosphaera sp.]
MIDPLLLVLEDDAERLARFRAVAAPFGVPLVVWRDARRMVAEAGGLLHRAVLISLDHDLEPDGDTDPGDGLDVAKHLATLPPRCRVIVHTSNGVRGDAMVGELELARWECRRVLPLGDDWVEVDWYSAARRAFRQARPLWGPR